MNDPGNLQIIHGMSIEQYHGMTNYISKTGLDRIERSPAYYYATTLDPNRPPEKERSGQLEGNLAHTAILEPDEFDKRYAVGPNVSRATKAWKEFEESLSPGVIGIKPDQRDTAMRQREQVLLLPDVAEALASGHAEVSAFWTDPETGVQCRCRPDWVHPAGDDAVLLVDIKTVSDPRPDEFARQCARKSYAKQAAFYSDGFEIASGKKVLGFIFVAVSNEYPYDASASVLDDDSMGYGRRQYQKNLQVYRECLQSGVWRGFDSGIHTVRLPGWCFYGEENEQDP